MASTMPNQWKTSDASCWQPWAFLNSKPPTSKFKPPSKRKNASTMSLLVLRNSHKRVNSTMLSPAIGQLAREELMPMPAQLARANRRHDRHSKSRPIIELTPHVSINDLCRWKVFPENYYTDHLLEMPLRYPFLKNLVISRQNIEFNHSCKYTQTFALHWIRTGFGQPRPIFVCQCGYGVRRLFLRHGHLACKHCHKAVYASQVCDHNTRKRLAASKLRLQLGGLPDINEPIPSKPKWTRRRTYQRIRNEIQALEAKARTRRFRKPLSTQLFAYHVS